MRGDVELHDALDQIAEIRQRLADTDQFRGFRAAPVVLSGILAIAAATAQPVLVPDPTGDLPAYLGLWVAVAAVSVAATGLTMYLRDHFGPSRTRHVTWLALRQFAPCLLAGALVTVALAAAPDAAALLPGLWQVLFSLGVFASARLLPRATFAVGVFYLFAGTWVLVLARGESALAPWAMGGPFGVGQLLTAAVLYWNLERRHEAV